MGIGTSGFTTTYIAYIPLLWPTKVPEMIALIKTTTGKNIKYYLGLGIMVGPLIGVGFYNIFSDPSLKY